MPPRKLATPTRIERKVDSTSFGRNGIFVHAASRFGNDQVSSWYGDGRSTINLDGVIAGSAPAGFEEDGAVPTVVRHQRGQLRVVVDPDALAGLGVTDHA